MQDDINNIINKVDEIRLARDQHFNDLQAELARKTELQQKFQECINKPPTEVIKEVIKEVPTEDLSTGQLFGVLLAKLFGKK